MLDRLRLLGDTDAVGRASFLVDNVNADSMKPPDRFGWIYLLRVPSRDCGWLLVGGVANESAPAIVM